MMDWNSFDVNSVPLSLRTVLGCRLCWFLQSIKNCLKTNGTSILFRSRNTQVILEWPSIMVRKNVCPWCEGVRYFPHRSICNRSKGCVAWELLKSNGVLLCLERGHTLQNSSNTCGMSLFRKLKCVKTDWHGCPNRRCQVLGITWTISALLECPSGVKTLKDKIYSPSINLPVSIDLPCWFCIWKDLDLNTTVWFVFCELAYGHQVYIETWYLEEIFECDIFWYFKSFYHVYQGRSIFGKSYLDRFCQLL